MGSNASRGRLQDGRAMAKRARALGRGPAARAGNGQSVGFGRDISPDWGCIAGYGRCRRGRGQLLRGDCDRATAERQAVGIARRDQLARPWRDQGKRTEARELLAPVYGWFTEGFGTPVLQQAKALLDDLAANLNLAIDGGVVSPNFASPRGSSYTTPLTAATNCSAFATYAATSAGSGVPAP